MWTTGVPTLRLCGELEAAIRVQARCRQATRNLTAKIGPSKAIRARPSVDTVSNVTARASRAGASAPSMRNNTVPFHGYRPLPVLPSHQQLVSPHERNRQRIIHHS